MTDRLFDPEGLDLPQRISRLEDAARHYAEIVRSGDELTAGVERLGDNAEALAVLLRTVSQNAEKIHAMEQKTADVERKTNDVARKTEEVALDAEAKVATAQIDRTLFFRRAHRLAAGVVALALLTVVVGAWVTDKHFQDCILQGPDDDHAERICDLTFPGHDHPQDITLEALLRRGAANQLASAKAQQEGCERTQQRLRIQVERERALAVVDAPATRALHARSADELEATLVDCKLAYPLPTRRS